MKHWNELKSKGGKMQRLLRATINYEIRNPIDKLLKDYRKTKNAELLEEARNYLIENKSEFSIDNQERIKLFLN